MARDSSENNPCLTDVELEDRQINERERDTGSHCIGSNHHLIDTKLIEGMKFNHGKGYN